MLLWEGYKPGLGYILSLVDGSYIGVGKQGAQLTERDDLWLSVAQSAAAKCDRCWHHVEDVGTIAGHEEICGRCVTNVEGDGETRQFA
ncbi:hypothetical protein MRR68_11945 [Aeromonas dhakensis]|nr:zinc finger domain-containing protein [Aeromonas dhakensis]MCJ2367687.1 hypothetical protein [Aeromonas dhakensis]